MQVHSLTHTHAHTHSNTHTHTHTNTHHTPARHVCRRWTQVLSVLCSCFQSAPCASSHTHKVGKGHAVQKKVLHIQERVQMQQGRVICLQRISSCDVLPRPMCGVPKCTRNINSPPPSHTHTHTHARTHTHNLGQT
jgi:hypothetical protein